MARLRGATKPGGAEQPEQQEDRRDEQRPAGRVREPCREGIRSAGGLVAERASVTARPQLSDRRAGRLTRRGGEFVGCVTRQSRRVQGGGQRQRERDGERRARESGAERRSDLAHRALRSRALPRHLDGTSRSTVPVS